jgi:hypothetical protein
MEPPVNFRGRSQARNGNTDGSFSRHVRGSDESTAFSCGLVLRGTTDHPRLCEMSPLWVGARGRFVAGTAEAVTGNGVSVKPIKENYRFLPLKIRRYGVRRQQG